MSPRFGAGVLFLVDVEVKSLVVVHVALASLDSLRLLICLLLLKGVFVILR
jgi:hypothetical protein